MMKRSLHCSNIIFFSTFPRWSRHFDCEIFAGCQLYGFIGGLTGTVSIMTLSMIAIDRYFAIVHPMNPLKKTTKSRAVLVIIFVWVYSLIFASIPIFSSLEYVPEGLLTSCSFDYLSSTLENRIFIFVYFLAAWLFPLTIIVFSYLAIFRMVVKAEKFCEFEQDGNSRKTYKTRYIHCFYTSSQITPDNSFSSNLYPEFGVIRTCLCFPPRLSC